MTGITAAPRLSMRLEDAAQELASDPQRVVMELDRIEREAVELSEWSIVGRARYLGARAATEAGDLESAVELLDGAASAHGRAGDELAALRTALGRMHVLDNLGRHADAVTTGEMALDEMKSRAGSAAADTDDWRLLEGALHENIGIALGIRGEFQRAMGELESADSAYSAVGADEDRLRLRANRGTQLVEIGRFRDAVAVLAGVAEEFAAIGDLWWHGVASAFLGRAHLGMGAPERAVEVARHGLEVLETLGAAAEALRAQLVLAATLAATGRSEESGHLAVSILVDAARLKQTPEMGQAWMLLGLSLAERGRLTGATRAFGKAARLHDIDGEARRGARARLARAEIALDENSAHADVAWVMSNLAPEDAPLEYARAELIVSRWLPDDAARIELENGLDRCREGATPSQLFASLETHLGRVSYRMGRADLAEQLLRRASRRDLRRRRLLDVGEQWSVSATRPVEAIDDLIAMLVGIDPSASSTGFDGTAFDGTAFDGAAFDSAVFDGAVFDGAVFDGAAFDGDVSEAFRLSETTKAPSLALHASRSTVRAESGLDPTDRELAPIDVDHALAWRDVGDMVVGFASVAGEVRASIVLDRDDVERAAGLVGCSVQRSIHASASASTCLELTRALDDAGVAIGVPELVDALGVDAGAFVSVSGHGVIDQLPLSSLGGLRDHLRVIERPTLALGSFADRDRASTLVVDCGGDDLTRRSDEIEAIRAVGLPCTVVGDVSSRDELAELVEGHDVIHILGHATPGSSRRQAEIEFGSWSLAESDLATMPFRGRLVVLSVCSGHALLRGAPQEPGGLTAGLLSAGAVGVLGSHWPVADVAAVAAATAVHAAIASGQSVSAVVESLRSGIRTTNPHPLMWAGWSLRSLAPTSYLTTEQVR